MADQTGYEEIKGLFEDIRLFRSSAEARKLLDFIVRFPDLAPFNALLVHMQRPGCQYATTAREWAKRYGRRVRFDARPIVILMPFRPVEYVFDICDTEPIPNFRGERPEIPFLATNPFRTSGEVPEDIWRRTLDNLPKEGVGVSRGDFGSSQGGQIIKLKDKYFTYLREKAIKIPYAVEISDRMDRTEAYATLTHELGHLFCDHFDELEAELGGEENGAPKGWKRERRRVREFEAECVSWIVCKRLGVETRSDAYLNSYLRENETIPPIGVQKALKVAGKIEAMGRPNYPTNKSLALKTDSREFDSYAPWDSRRPLER